MSSKKKRKKKKDPNFLIRHPDGRWAERLTVQTDKKTRECISIQIEWGTSIEKAQRYPAKHLAVLATTAYEMLPSSDHPFTDKTMFIPEVSLAKYLKISENN